MMNYMDMLMPTAFGTRILGDLTELNLFCK